MRPRAIIFILLALALAGVTVNFARNRLTAARQQAVEQTHEPSTPTTLVLVAAKDLPAGALVRSEDFQWQSWPDDGQISDAYMRKGRDDPETLAGSVVRLHLAKGEPINAGRVIKQGDRGFLAAVLAPGMRGTSVPLTASSDVAGLILPGDHVDLILSHPVKDDQQPNAPARIISETVLTNLRVVAIDQIVNDQDKKPLGGKTATFEVTPKQAEKIEVAKMLGNLSLVLRSAGADDEKSDGITGSASQVSHTWDSDVSPVMHREQPGIRATVAVTVLRGAGSSGPGLNSAPDPSAGRPGDTR
jgi:pilus assembly protein CpaB